MTESTISRAGMVSGENPERALQQRPPETPARDAFEVLDEYARTKRLPYSRSETRMLAKELGWDK